MPFPSVMNFRDLGGKPAAGGQVRTGLVFRTGTLAYATPGDARALADRFGLTHYCDFRTAGEVSRDGEPEAVVAAGVEWVRLPFETHDDAFGRVPHPNGRDWAELYLRLCERRADVFARLAGFLAEAPGPVAYGCAIGKDRTGMASALLLDLFGVAPDLIVADYLATTDELRPHHHRFAAAWTGTPKTREQVIADWFTCHPETMTLFLEGLAARGGAAALFAQGGATSAVLDRLCARHVERGG
jgi:hypothetical protein